LIREKSSKTEKNIFLTNGVGPIRHLYTEEGRKQGRKGKRKEGWESENKMR
jgi:hypothetical protein